MTTLPLEAKKLFVLAGEREKATPKVKRLHSEVIPSFRILTTAIFGTLFHGQ